MNQIANTYPAGVKNVGYASEISPTVYAPRIEVLLKLLMIIVRNVATTFDSDNRRLNDRAMIQRKHNSLNYSLCRR
jgi:hypothetical protein